MSEPLGLLDVLSPYVGVLVVAFLVTVVVTPWLRGLAVTHGIVDVPDLQRKNHALPVAYLGGVAIFLGFSIAAIAVTAFPAIGGFGQVREGRPPIPFPLSILAGAAVITITGLFDDVGTIRARVKVGGQLFAAAALAYENIGVHLAENAFGVIGLPWRELNAFSLFGSPLGDSLVYAGGTFLIAVMVLGACNSVNLLDGLDGLAAGVVAVAMTGFLVLSLIVASRAADPSGVLLLHLWDPVRIIMCLATIGAILGFLPYNFRPASIFMGDAGSLLLGYLAATSILLFSDTGAQSLLLVTAALIVFAVPITDTSLAIIRRKLRGMPLFAPDNQHIHHLLRQSGLSVRQSVLVMYAAGVGFALLGVGMVAAELQWRYILVVFCVLYGSIMATAFKYGSLQHSLDLQRKAAASDPIALPAGPAAAGASAAAPPPGGAPAPAAEAALPEA
ncbi:glycosyltransferase family 4 protein [Phycisphaera mikurensis]|uniref:Undecaprenyl-phosphate N-acetylglucosaminyl 1-phosphate transferase n=1 Tax=Phycisphaera mikurensis (strain NBRC 102666 / KCTC 22515 / FYK2301M01) TaxID=1142394 RepID=I0IGK9_PHYMF|nr:MraY family glycosyltransferase [Phycisphaera mikurensis]MBB6442921.1 UDP-GlcNAc:undecaprenyl-phosphate GlcNAc-1-phosphate transferase [Phycisphaera mikurensis]BAM04397.1 undecaprenyl-phosphate N-acetylglucosaminyl 1-phosphate transferase [Phycisphaera mikurensis NBRC 102666]